jgi:hypothetical protein
MDPGDQTQRVVPRACVSNFISCNQTRFGALDFSDCSDASGLIADFWFFTGQAGQTVTIDLSSSAFDPFLTLHHPNTAIGVVAGDDDSGPGLNAHLSYVLTTTSSQWAIGASNGVDAFGTGSYTLTLACSGVSQPTPTPTRTSTPPGPVPTATPPSPTATATPPGVNTMPCVRDDQTACLLDDRFEVRVQMKNHANPPVTFPGIIQLYQGATSETEQSVSFYSFNNGNVEVFVKMVDACGLPAFNSFWLFAAGATDAETTITARDTHSGLVRTITNQSGQLFLPYANTQAFLTCAQGG